MPELEGMLKGKYQVGSCSAWPSQLNAALLSFAGRRLQRTVQLLLLLAAYLLVTAVLKSSLDLSKRMCCVLALGEPLFAVHCINNECLVMSSAAFCLSRSITCCIVASSFITQTLGRLHTRLPSLQPQSGTA